MYLQAREALPPKRLLSKAAALVAWSSTAVAWCSTMVAILSLSLVISVQ